jgi:ABC-2 type transport system ATP-binding protein
MIILKKLSKSYQKKSVLKDLNLKIPDGKIQAIFGENGSGKSTLIKCIANIIDFQSGEIFFDQTSIKSNNNYKKNVGYLFDVPTYIDKFSAKEYLTFLGHLYKLPKKEIQKKIEKLMDIFELPKGRQYIESYSVGTKNKVSIAAALLHEPQYLILDEPFDGLDFIACQRLSRILKEIAEQGGTILITSHQFDLIIPISDYFGLLIDGKIHLNVDSLSLAP